MKTNIYIKALYILIVGILSLFILEKIGCLSFILSLINQCSFIFLSAILVIVFEPLITLIPWFNRAIRCTIVYLSLFFFIGIVLTLVLPTLVGDLGSLQEYFIDIIELSSFNTILDFIQQFDLTQGMKIALDSTVLMIGKISQFALSYIAAYFISLDLPDIMHGLKRLFKNNSTFTSFYHTSNNVVLHYFKGMGLDLLFLFVSESLVLWLFQVRHPLIYAIMVAFLNLIPYVGATIGQIVIVLVDYLNTGIFRIELFIICALIQQIEANFIQPYIFNKVLDVKPIVSLISIIIFGSLFGFAGFILAPVLAVIAQLVYRSYLYTNQTKTVGTWENMWYDFDEINDEDK